MQGVNYQRKDFALGAIVVVVIGSANRTYSCEKGVRKIAKEMMTAT
jgi:hypothetical protein